MGKLLNRHSASRRFLFAMTAILLFASSPAYAAAQATPAASPTGPQTGEGYVPFRFEETVTITMMTSVRSQESGPPPADWEWLQQVRDDLNIDVQIQWITNASEYTPTLRTRAAANDLPDVFTTDLATTALLVDQGLVADWNPLLQYMPTYVRDREVTELAPIGTFEGLHASLVTKNADPFKGVIAIRQDWLDKLGLEVPTTTEEFLAVAQAFTTQDPDGNGSADTYGFTGSINADGFIAGIGGLSSTGAGFTGIGGAFGDTAPWKVAEDGSLEFRAVTDEHRQYLEFLSQLQAAGVIDPDWGSQDSLDMWAKWKAGRIGILFEDWCALFCVQGYGEFKAANPEGVYTPIQPPVGPNGQSTAGERSNVGMQYGISQNAVDGGRGEAVARLLEWINGPGYLATVHGPMEGRDWERNAEGKILQIKDVNVLQYRQLTGWALIGSPDELFARYDSITTYADGQVLDVYDVVDYCGAYPLSDTTQWFALPPHPPETYADFIRTQAEAEYAFVSGQRSFDEWDSYVESLDSVGLENWTNLATERARELDIVQ